MDSGGLNGKFIYLSALTLLIFTSTAMSATDTLFSSGVTFLTTLLTGTGGTLVTLAALVAFVVAAAAHGTSGAGPGYMTTFFGVAILASIGPSIVSTFFTATL